MAPARLASRSKRREEPREQACGQAGRHEQDELFHVMT